MDNYDFKPNSHKYKNEQKKKEQDADKKISKVVHGSVKVKKKSGVSKFAETFIAEDVNNVKSYVVTDVIVPAIKNLILDVITDSANMIFGGSARRKGNTPASRIAYGSFFNTPKTGRRVDERSVKPRYSYDELFFETRNDAMEVLSVLGDALDRYGQVTVADLYDAAGQTGEFTDNDYGWVSLSTAEIGRSREGYYIKLPRALPLER